MNVYHMGDVSLEEHRRRCWATLPLIAKYAKKDPEEIAVIWRKIEEDEYKKIP